MTRQQQQFWTALPSSWKQPLQQVCQRSEIDRLIKFLQERESAGAIIYPQKKNIFAALQGTAFDDVKVVIVGQDPYHGPNQAHGLSFSVLPGVAQPPSLQNIFKELHSDIGMPRPQHGTLTSWANEGVLLLNAILTVEKGTPASHAGKGWELFTDGIIQALMRQEKPIVFMLWGAYAQKKVANIAHDPSHHLILKTAHPSPFSATGFLGCRHFSQANTFLKNHNLPEIDWTIR